LPIHRRENPMKEMVAELVHVILQRSQETGLSPLADKSIRSWLAKKGYKKNDIDAAMKVVSSRSRKPPVATSHSALRQLSQWEQSKMAPEARAALARLDQYEMLSPYEREMLLERISQMEGEVTLDDLDYLVSWLLCSVRDFETQNTLYQIFEGAKKQLN
jgi:uncharacterized protein Smg (DUF494 family)